MIPKFNDYGSSFYKGVHNTGGILVDHFRSVKEYRFWDQGDLFSN